MDLKWILKGNFKTLFGFQFSPFCPPLVLSLLKSKSSQPRQPAPIPSHPIPSRSISSCPVPSGSGCHMAWDPSMDHHDHLRIDIRLINRPTCDTCQALAINGKTWPRRDLSHEINLWGCVSVFKAGTQPSNSLRCMTFADYFVQFWPRCLLQSDLSSVSSREQGSTRLGASASQQGSANPNAM